MDLSNLTKEEKEKLFADLKAEKQAEAEKKEQEREAYKNLKDEAVREIFEYLNEMSQKMIHLKGVVFSRFDTIIELKDDLFKSKSDRQSDTFTTEDGLISIKLGNRVNEGWDDTVEVGITKVKEYLRTLAKDENSANLVESVMRLIAKDRKGNLKASKVLELEQLAMRTKDENFQEAIQIIRSAYRPSPSCQFIEVKYKDENGKELSLPLSMSAII